MLVSSARYVYKVKGTMNTPKKSTDPFMIDIDLHRIQLSRYHLNNATTLGSHEVGTTAPRECVHQARCATSRLTEGYIPTVMFCIFALEF